MRTEEKLKEMLLEARENLKYYCKSEHQYTVLKGIIKTLEWTLGIKEEKDGILF